MAERVTILEAASDRPKPMPQAISEPEQKLYMARRQALIIELGSIEDYLGMPRSIVPQRKRAREHQSQN